MKRKFNVDFILIRIINNNFIETSSFFELLVVNFTAEKIKKLLLIKHSLKPISSFKFLSITYIFPKVHSLIYILHHIIRFLPTILSFLHLAFIIQVLFLPPYRVSQNTFVLLVFLNTKCG